MLQLSISGLHHLLQKSIISQTLLLLKELHSIGAKRGDNYMMNMASDMCKLILRYVGKCVANGLVGIMLRLEL